jgi:class 3 adenylate cyclase
MARSRLTTSAPPKFPVPPKMRIATTQPSESTKLRARLLGPLSVSLGELSAGPWERPSARRLLELVLVSPGRRIGKEVACEALFPHLASEAAARALYKAKSMAKATLSGLGDAAAGLLVADGALIFLMNSDGLALEVDFEEHQKGLKSGLSMPPGLCRDDALVAALSEEGILLQDEPYADWALRPREALESLRREARLALARDRARGFGRSGAADVTHAWEGCFASDPTCEEAATALLRGYFAQGEPALATSTYRRCSAALESLGLAPSRSLDALYAASAPCPGRTSSLNPRPSGRAGERRALTVLFVELAGTAGIGAKLSPEDLSEVVGGALAAAVAAVEDLDGTVTSLSGSGLVALFGAPVAHEDDPERALRAAFRCTASAGAKCIGLSMRAGIETGRAVVGMIGGGSRGCYGALGAVVATAAALQSVARPGSVLVGPATRAATADLFKWGPTEDVVVDPETKPVRALYVERPWARPAGEAGRHGPGRSDRLVGRASELAMLQEAIDETTQGRGGVVVISGDPGLGKTRLVRECRERFRAWVEAAPRRLDLWFEGRAASYASSSHYGPYQQLLSAWAGVDPQDGEVKARGALERAVKAVFGAEATHTQIDRLAHVMGLGTDNARVRPPWLSHGEPHRAAVAAVRDFICRLVAHGPTVIVLEDLHWAAPSSLELTVELASLTLYTPLLLVLTARPEPASGLSALGATIRAVAGLNPRTIDLTVLAPDAESDMARALLGPGAPDDLISELRQVAEGNPLFLKENLSSLLRSGALVRDEAGAWRLVPDMVREIPETLERLVFSRVDRLGQISHDAIIAASVLGQEFSSDALAAVTGIGPAMQEVLAELFASGLLVELGARPEPKYRFCNRLVQEAIYKSRLKGQRQQLHFRAAWGLEERAVERLGEVASFLGHHYTLAEEVERANHFCGMAKVGELQHDPSGAH